MNTAMQSELPFNTNSELEAMLLIAPEAAPEPPDILALLRRWTDLGWLRHLDSAMAAFIRELHPTASPAVLVSTAVLTHMEGRGHTCLPLRALALEPASALAWPPAANAEIDALWQTLPKDTAGWIAALRASPVVRALTLIQAASAKPSTTDQGQPLVLINDAPEPLLYLRRYWLHEQQVAKHLLQRTKSCQPVDEKLARQWLDRLFDQTDSPAQDNRIDWQKLACAVALRSSLTVITGGPGTGKTYTAARLLALLFAMDREPASLRVALAAPTGKAAARLRQSIDASLQELSLRLGDVLDLKAFTTRMGAARTLHSLLGARLETRQFRFHAGNLLDVDILIVDEASMIHLEMMSALLQALPSGAKLILLGDKDQLASVEAGAVLGDLCLNARTGHYNSDTTRYALAVSGQTVAPEYCQPSPASTPLAQQTVMLRESRRFDGLIGQLARAVNDGKAALAQSLIENDTTGVLRTNSTPNLERLVALAVRGRAGATACFADYLHVMAQSPSPESQVDSQHSAWVKRVLVAFDRFRILCAVRDGVWGTLSLNLSIQQALADAELLKPRGEWYIGRPVMVTRNDSELGVFNGDVGVTLPGLRDSAALRVYFLDGDNLRSVGANRLAHVETAFAMTVHKSQGSEFLHTALALPPGGDKHLTRELIYTGITRAREQFTLVEGQTGLLRSAILKESHRASGLRQLLEKH
jgi:exodeoxyribonuclease V alpha subunit